MDDMVHLNIATITNPCHHSTLLAYQPLPPFATSGLPIFATHFLSLAHKSFPVLSISFCLQIFLELSICFCLPILSSSFYLFLLTKLASTFFPALRKLYKGQLSQ
jgi:hypothetical protein